jgi:hypothetical protein
MSTHGRSDVGLAELAKRPRFVGFNARIAERALLQQIANVRRTSGSLFVGAPEVPTRRTGEVGERSLDK